MKKKFRLVSNLSSILTLIGLFILSVAFFYFSTVSNLRDLFTKVSLPPLKAIQKPTPPTELNGWIAWWDGTSALESLNKNPKLYKTVSPVWYKINEQGKIEKAANNLEEQITGSLNKQNIKLIPTITNDFNPRSVSFILNNSDIYLNLIENLKTLALNLDYQGFDIDWEEIDPKDQEAFTAFVDRLSETLHQADLVLTISVHPQTGKPSDRAVAKGYDLKALSKNADALKIMAYDFHNQNSGPGAITPFDQLNSVLNYITATVPVEKIILGLPVYGYDWGIGTKKPAEAVSFKQASDRIKANKGQIQRDPESNALVGNYEVNGVKHVIWYEDAQTITKMIALARSKGIYQFSFWRIGVEDPALFEQFKNSAN